MDDKGMTVAVPDGIHADFCFTCDSDSMKRSGIMPGDVIFVCRASDFDDRQIGVLQIGEERILGMLFHHQNGVEVAFDFNYLPGTRLFLEGEAKLVGIVTGWTHWETRRTDPE